MNAIIERWKRLPNWSKHVIVALVAGIITRAILLILSLLFLGIQIGLSVMAWLVWLMLIIIWESRQYDVHPMTYNLLDGVIDVLIGAVCFALPLFAWNPVLKVLFK